MRAEGLSENGVLLAESGAAREAEDFDAMWSWMARAKLAEQEFGEDWLDKQANLRKEKNFFETRVTEYQTGGALQWD